MTKRRNDDDSDSDVDGAPLRSDSHPTTPSSSSNATDKSKLPAGFVPSKWETIEPEEVQAQVGGSSFLLIWLPRDYYQNVI